MTVAVPAARRARRLPAAAFCVALAASSLPALEPPAPPPPHTGIRPTSKERVVSVWAGLAGADASSADVRQAGVPGTGSDTDFSPFVLLGARFEYFPDISARVGKHFGFGIDVTAMAGEADIEIRPLLPAEEVGLGAVVIAPSLVVRFPGRTRWEGYAGFGFTLLWASVLTDVAALDFDEEPTDNEVPLALSLYAGFRRTGRAGWFFMMEGRYQAGENDFDLRDSLTTVHLEWRTAQIVFGSGYRF